MSPDGWKPREPEWADLAPGIRWLIKPRDGSVDAMIEAQVAQIMGRFYEGRADLERVRLPVELFGDIADLDKLAGLSVLIGAILYADQLVEAWEGMDHVENGEPLELNGENLTAALFLGPPEGGGPMYETFLAWVKRPTFPVAADAKRLRELAKWEFGGGAKHCEGCDQFGSACAKGGTDGGDLCPRRLNQPRTAPAIAAWRASNSPGAWLRAGMGGEITGLDRRACLASATAEGGQGWLDEAAVIRHLSAIEAGALEALAERTDKPA